MRSIFCLGLAILLSSCATTNTNYHKNTMQSWNGRSMSSITPAAFAQKKPNPDMKVASR